MGAGNAGTSMPAEDSYYWMMRALRAESVLHSVACEKRPDGSWNNGREACQEMAEEALRESGLTR